MGVYCLNRGIMLQKCSPWYAKEIYINNIRSFPFRRCVCKRTFPYTMLNWIYIHIVIYDINSSPAYHGGSLRWRHNERDSVSNHQPHGCLLNGLLRRRSKKTSKLRVTGLCVGNSPGPVNSPHKGPVTRKMFPFDDVIMYSYCDKGPGYHQPPTPFPSHASFRVTDLSSLLDLLSLGNWVIFKYWWTNNIPSHTS